MKERAHPSASEGASRQDERGDRRDEVSEDDQRNVAIDRTGEVATLHEDRGELEEPRGSEDDREKWEQGTALAIGRRGHDRPDT
jgi:hypothetical protein